MKATCHLVKASCHYGGKQVQDYPSQLADRFIIRLPDGWRDAMKAEAVRNRRSMNAEFLAAIETAMRIKGVQLERAS